MSVFSDRLKKRRLLKDWSKSATAQKLGISAQRYSNWEYGSREPDYEMLISIAKLFNTTTDYLTGKTDDPMPNTESQKDDLDEMIDDARFFDGKQMDDHDKELVRSILKRIYNEK